MNLNERQICMNEEKKAAILKYFEKRCNEADSDYERMILKHCSSIFIKGYELGKREAEDIGEKEQVRNKCKA